MHNANTTHVSLLIPYNKPHARHKPLPPGRKLELYPCQRASASILIVILVPCLPPPLQQHRCGCCGCGEVCSVNLKALCREVVMQLLHGHNAHLLPHAAAVHNVRV